MYKHAGSRQERYTLLKLYNGNSLARTFHSLSGRVPRTPFNVSGFIQPGLLLEQLQKADIDGFNDRQLLDCPAEIDPMYDQLTPLNTNGVTFKVFDTIMHILRGPNEIDVYHLNEKASLFSLPIMTTSVDAASLMMKRVSLERQRVSSQELHLFFMD